MDKIYDILNCSKYPNLISRDVYRYLKEALNVIVYELKDRKERKQISKYSKNYFRLNQLLNKCQIDPKNRLFTKDSVYKALKMVINREIQEQENFYNEILNKKEEHNYEIITESIFEKYKNIMANIFENYINEEINDAPYPRECW